MQLFPPQLRVLTLLNEVALIGEVEKLRRHPLPLERGPVKPDIGKPYLRATTSLQPLALLEIKPGAEPSEPGHSIEPDAGSISLRWWRRRESNPRPKMLPRGRLLAYPVVFVAEPEF
jgi:hypothetical protein